MESPPLAANVAAPAAGTACADGAAAAVPGLRATRCVTYPRMLKCACDQRKRAGESRNPHRDATRGAERKRRASMSHGVSIARAKRIARKAPATCVATARVGGDGRLHAELLVDLEEARLKKGKGQDLVAVFFGSASVDDPVPLGVSHEPYGPAPSIALASSVPEVYRREESAMATMGSSSKRLCHRNARAQPPTRTPASCPPRRTGRGRGL